MILRRRGRPTSRLLKSSAALVIACLAAAPPDLMTLAKDGEKLSDDQAAALEAAADRDPADGVSRGRLLGYYLPRKAAKRDRRDRTILWVVDRKPDDPVASSAYCRIDPVDDPDGYAVVDKAWDKKLSDKPTTATKSAAAAFKAPKDFDGAERLLKELRDAEPKSPAWLLRLADLYDQQGVINPAEDRRMAGRSLQVRQSAYDLTTAPVERFRVLSRMPSAACRAGDLITARSLAEQLLATSKSFKSDPYYGYAVHWANIALGRASVSDRNYDKAVEYLAAAGRVSSSPILASEGVDSSLAAEVLRHGDRTAVRDYLDSAERLWPAGGQRLRSWSAAVDSGETPDFKR